MLITTHGLKLMVKADQESYDFTINDFTADYQYHDLDLSGIIPAGTVAIVLWGAFRSDAPDTEACFAKAGNSGNYLKSLLIQPVFNIGKGINCIVPVSSDLKIKYRFSNVNYSYINLIIAGWFI